MYKIILRLIAVYKLRKKEFRFCRICKVPLTDEENSYYCYDCIEYSYNNIEDNPYQSFLNNQLGYSIGNPVSLQQQMYHAAGLQNMASGLASQQQQQMPQDAITYFNKLLK